MIKKELLIYCAAISCLVLLLISSIKYCNITNLKHRIWWVNKSMELPTFLYKHQMRIKKDNEEQFSPMFAFITQTEQCLPTHWLDDNHVGNFTLCNCHVYVVSYRTPCQQPRAHIFYQHNTTVGWSGGRNNGYFEAKKHGGYLYYIFFDDDVTLSYNTYTPRKLVENKIPPLKIFTEYLSHHRPAAAGTDFEYLSPNDQILDIWHKKCKRFEVPRAIPLYHFDALINAFHKDTVNYLLPYYDKFDHVSFWLSQLHFCWLFQMVFYGRFEFIPYVSAHNPTHRYTQKGHLSDMDIRKKMVDNIRERTSMEYRTHTRFVSMMAYDYHLNMAAVICEDPPKSRSPIVPYQRMEMPEVI